MSKARVVVSKVVSKQMSVSEAAAAYGVSRQHVHRWLARYRDGGFDGLEPRSRRPHSNPRRTASAVAERIVALRRELAGQGLDHGPQTIGWHLEHEQLPVPSTSTIRRILLAAGLVTPEPKKRPKSSYRRFEADQPNECWQSDFTHWQLTDGSGVEIINWLDDHSRYLLAAIVRPRITGEDVVTTFLAAADAHGLPRSTLTDNGSVYTSRFTGGRNGFEYLLASLGIVQKNGHPNHPQTQGKIERFHQTQKRWLAAQPPAATMADLQAQLDRFQRIYNTLRPHRALNRTTPAAAYAATPKSTTGHHIRRGLQPLPAALRPNRQPRQDQLPTRRPDAPPRRRRQQRTPPRPRHRRPDHRHRHRPHHRRNPQHPHHRPRPQLLAQPTKKPRPMAKA
jgi:transposase InsO family protein